MKTAVKPQTLTLNKEFKRAYYQGKSKASPFFVCYVVKNKNRGVRYGITASKKLGNAVQRNRARRVIRAAFFSILSKLAYFLISSKTHILLTSCINSPPLKTAEVSCDSLLHPDTLPYTERGVFPGPFLAALLRLVS
jgi:ribonuclease P protein component